MEAGDEAVAVDLGEALLIGDGDVGDDVEFGSIVGGELLVDHLDLNKVVDVTFLDFRGVEVGCSVSIQVLNR